MLTVGIPTYNRMDEIFRLTKWFIQQKFGDGIRLLIIDDGSTDGTMDKLEQLATGWENIVVLSHDTNEGYARTYIDIFKNCRTEYLVVGTDDDLIPEGKLENLRKDLAYRPCDFMSTQFLAGKVLYRGKKEK